MRRPNVAIAIMGVTLTFAGAFSAFTYFRPFLETRTQVDLPQLSALLLALGLAGFVGTTAVSLLLRRHLYRMLRWLPLVLGVITLALLAVEHHFWSVALMLILWGALNSAIPVAWSAWITQGIPDSPESGGGLMVAAIQLAITLGAAVGGWLLDSLSISATFMGSALLLTAASMVVGNGSRLRPITLDQ